MKLAFLYSIQIIGQIIITGSKKVSKYHVSLYRNNKDNIPVINEVKKQYIHNQISASLNMVKAA